MIKLRFLYYGTRKDGKLMDDIIGRTSHAANKKKMVGLGDVPMLAHCEVEICNTEAPDVTPVLCYTSTMGQMRDRGVIRNLFKKGDGTICRPSTEVLTNPERWYYIDVFVSENVFRLIQEYLQYEVTHNKGYDVRCILSFLCGFRFHHPKKNICSEVLHRVAILCSDNMPNDPRLACYNDKYSDTWNDVPSPILQMLNMVCCGYQLRRLDDNSIVIG